MNPQQRPYSQLRALLAITRASFKAIFAHPSAIIFSIIFPIIFVMIFGAFGSGGGISFRVALEKGSDTANEFVRKMRGSGILRFAEYQDSISLEEDLVKGKLTAVLLVREQKDSTGPETYTITTRSSSASSNVIQQFYNAVDYFKLKFERNVHGVPEELVTITNTPLREVRRYRQIDFILPGQLGFSILFSTLFGIAFTFFGLREQLVLKRFYASPVKKINILLGIGMSRLFFQLLSVVVLMTFGHFVLNFTLQHGVLTFIEIIFMTIIMLFLLMGVGLIFSSIVKSDTSIPLLINLFGFPQMMLSGTFFPIEVFPKWLQTICKVLPLTQYNDAVRKISFEGLSLLDCGKEIGILAIWMMVAYIIAIRVLKWE